jgi:hypothetical protein
VDLGHLQGRKQAHCKPAHTQLAKGC